MIIGFIPVGFVLRNALVPIPVDSSLDELNENLKSVAPKKQNKEPFPTP